MSKEEKEVYVKLFEAAKEGNTAVNTRDTNVKGSSLEKIAQAVKNDNPQFVNFYARLEYSCYADDPATLTGENTLRHDYFLIGDSLYSNHTPLECVTVPLTDGDYIS